jgi:hypothetical protein
MSDPSIKSLYHRRGNEKFGCREEKLSFWVLFLSERCLPDTLDLQLLPYKVLKKRYQHLVILGL